MLSRLPVVLFCLVASVSALSTAHFHRGVAHRAVAHRAVQPTPLRRRSNGKRCKVRTSSSIHKTVDAVSTSIPALVTTQTTVEPTKVESTTKAESTVEPTTKAESTKAPVTTKAESTEAPPTTKAEPTTTKAEPVTTKAPATTKAEPVTTKAPATTDAPTTKAEPVTTKAPATTEAPPTTKAPAPATTKAPASNSNLPSFLVGTQNGQGTFYSTGLGACGITNTDTDYIAAVSHLLFDAFPGYNGVNPNTNPLCGRQVTASYNGKSVTVTLTDRCEACALTDLDFSPAAFNTLANPAEGRIFGMLWHWD